MASEAVDHPGRHGAAGAGVGLTPPWRWRERNGMAYHLPQEMETRHLFYTLRMTWNNYMPDHMRVGRRVKLYNFGPYYTNVYMMQAVICIGAELFERNDIDLMWQTEIDQMRSWFETDPVGLVSAGCALNQTDRTPAPGGETGPDDGREG